MTETQAPYRVQVAEEGPSDHERVLSLLRRHVGQEQAIPSRRIASLLMLDTRQVRQVIADLVKAGELIGATVDGKAGGYFMIDSLEDLEATRAILRARAAAIFERDRDLCDAWVKEHGKPLQPLLFQLEAE